MDFTQILHAHALVSELDKYGCPPNVVIDTGIYIVIIVLDGL